MREGVQRDPSTSVGRDDIKVDHVVEGGMENKGMVFYLLAETGVQWYPSTSK